jgi:hypothetical protein
MPLTPAELSLRGQKAAHTSWGNTRNRTARTAKGRKAFEDKFLEKADGDPQRAESLRRAYYADLVFKSVQARRRRREAAQEARRQAIAELIAG